jgi:hypothetical protein
MSEKNWVATDCERDDIRGILKRIEKGCAVTSSEFAPIVRYVISLEMDRRELIKDLLIFGKGFKGMHSILPSDPLYPNALRASNEDEVSVFLREGIPGIKRLGCKSERSQ